MTPRRTNAAAFKTLLWLAASATLDPAAPEEDMMDVKSIAMVTPNPTAGRSFTETQRYCVEVHGKLVANNQSIRRYYHVITLPEATELDPPANMVAVAVLWRDASSPIPSSSTWTASASQSTDPQEILRIASGADDRQAFDRIEEWPRHAKRANVIGEEHIIVDGATTPSTICALYAVAKRPGLAYNEFFDHWLDVQGPLVARLPGLRRYTQNHAITDWLASRAMTHDGWSELWFDDFNALKRAMASAEWADAYADARMLFAGEMAICIGTVRHQKDETWQPQDFGANSMTEDEVRKRLLREGYGALAADPTAPAKIKAAANKGLLAVWTDEHIVTLDESRIDERPHP